MSEWVSAGKVRMTPKGTYDPTVSYSILDLVASSNKKMYYISKSGVPAGTPLTNTTYWDCILNVNDNNSIIATPYESIIFPVSVGTLTIYDGVLYIANTNIDTAEAWDQNHWISTNISNLIADLNNSVDVLNNKSDDIKNFSLGAYYLKETYGLLAKFNDGANDTPVENISITINPIQSGSGEPSITNQRPFVSKSNELIVVSGKNLLPNNIETRTGDNNDNGFNVIRNEDGSFVVTGEMDTSIEQTHTRIVGVTYLKAGSYKLLGCPLNGAGSGKWRLRLGKGNGTGGAPTTIVNNDTGSGLSFTVSEESYYTVNYLIETTSEVNLTFRPMIILATDSVDYEKHNGNLYNIALVNNYYGGVLDATSGILKEFAFYSSYNGEVLVGPWLSSLDVYNESSNPTVGAEVIDLGKFSNTYSINPIEVRTVSGLNYIYADNADVYVKYRVDINLYPYASREELNDSNLNILNNTTAIDNLNNECSVINDFTIGVINANCEFDPNTSRASTGIIKSNGGYLIMNPNSNMEYNVRYWDSSLSASSSKLLYSDWTTKRTKSIDYPYFAIFFKKNDSSTYTAEDIANMKVVVYNTFGSSTKGAYVGKCISILGDSISTYGDDSQATASDPRLAPSGCITNYPGNRIRYPSQMNGLNITEVNQVYWYKLIMRLGMKLGINESWAGSYVSWDGETEGDDVGVDKHMASQTRINHLGEGTNGEPDYILINGGTNDLLGGVSLGTVNYENPINYSDEDIASLPVNTFADAYRTMLIRVMKTYPNAKVVCMTPSYTKRTQYSLKNYDDMCEIIKEICDMLGVYLIDTRLNGISVFNINEYLGDNVHYNQKGMCLIADLVTKAFLYNV